MRKRGLIAFTALLLLFGSIVLRVYQLTSSELSQAAQQQSTLTVTVANTRGTIYDCRMRPLVNEGLEYRACIAPFPITTAMLSKTLEPSAWADLNERLKLGKPVVTTLQTLLPPTEGISQFQVAKRYSGTLLAPHLLGYMDAEGTHGLTGVELAFDEYLNSVGGSLSVTYSVDANGRPLQGVQPTFQNTLSNADAGVVLTLDADIQKLAEKAARSSISRGAIVIMEPSTGRILAMVSLPDFQPDTVAECLEAPYSPLLNRTMCNYNCGSIFKIVSCAAALEAGVSTDTTFTCTGSVKIGNVIFHCHNKLGHGTLDMKNAFAQSCNPYFIQLIQLVGAENMYAMATTMGYDRALLLADGMKTARAILPSLENLQLPAELANLSIGQGELMATPIHVAQMVSTVLNGGQLIRPTILKGYVDSAGVFTEAAISPPQTTFSEEIAATLREFLVYAVNHGTGTTARPSHGGAGGKTGTAETGWVQNGESVVQSWYAGYYPGERPRYAIAVLAEDKDTTGARSAPLFKKLCDELYLLELGRGEHPSS